MPLAYRGSSPQQRVVEKAAAYAMYEGRRRGGGSGDFDDFDN
jgi:hypothetical protein